jgi:ferredoxin-type protein NapH
LPGFIKEVRTLRQESIHGNRFLISRRLMQVAIMYLFVAANVYGWRVLSGNLSFAKVFGKIPLADPFAALQMLAAGRVPAGDILTGAAVTAVFYGLVAGRAFCAWVCPMNVVTDTANRLARKFSLHTPPHPSGEASGKMNRGVRYWVLALALVMSFLMGVSAFEWISPIGMLHRGIIYGAGLGLVGALCVFLFDLLAVENGFCGHVCPLGGFYSLIGRYALIKPRYDKDKCTQCMRCVDICPERQALDMVGKRSAAVTSGECVNCGRCIEVCKDDAIGFGIGRTFGDKL